MKLRSYFGLLLVSALPICASADNFVNGSFENPTLVNGTIAFYPGNSLPGWNADGPLGACVLTNGYTVGSGTTWNPTPAGNQYLYINPDTAPGDDVYQSVFLAAGQYQLTFLEADFGTAYNIPGGQVGVTVYEGALTVASQQFSTPAFSPFIQQSMLINAPSSDDYTFYFSGNANHGAIIDDVSIAATPEPNAALMLSAGLGLLAVGSRRRAKRTQD